MDEGEVEVEFLELLDHFLAFIHLPSTSLTLISKTTWTA